MKPKEVERGEKKKKTPRRKKVSSCGRWAVYREMLSERVWYPSVKLSGGSWRR